MRLDDDLDAEALYNVAADWHNDPPSYRDNDALYDFATHPAAWREFIDWANAATGFENPADIPAPPLPPQDAQQSKSTKPGGKKRRTIRRKQSDTTPDTTPRNDPPSGRRGLPVSGRIVGGLVAAFALVAAGYGLGAYAHTDAKEASTSTHKQVAVTARGDDFGCRSVVGSRSVECAGSNSVGQLGRGDTGGDHTSIINLAAKVEGLVAGDAFACARTSDGAWCWGDNRFGQILLSDAAFVKPTKIGLPDGKVTDLVAGRVHACALVNEAAYCWGANNVGQAASQGEKVGPVRIAGVKAQALTASGFTTCAHAKSKAWCWGSNADGRIKQDDAEVLGVTSVKGR